MGNHCVKRAAAKFAAFFYFIKGEVIPEKKDSKSPFRVVK
jgi:hypothetical protein